MNVMVMYCRRLESKGACPPFETPDQLYDRYGEMARWQGSGAHDKLEWPRPNVAMILEEYVP